VADLDVIGTDSVTLSTVSTYLDFIVARAAGELMTPAAWMREYIRKHPDYKYDALTLTLTLTRTTSTMPSPSPDPSPGLQVRCPHLVP
jgi:hypothetical protein